MSPVGCQGSGRQIRGRADAAVGAQESSDPTPHAHPGPSPPRMLDPRRPLALGLALSLIHI
eukprot:6610289-Pyramimonas_sp.AAC.1